MLSQTSLVMAIVMVVTLLLAMVGGNSGTQWCICKTGLNNTILQKTLDYACGAGADCKPIHPNNPCYEPDTVRDHCSYAANSYFQRKGQIAGSCDFAGAATITTSDPSPSGTCSFPSSASGAGTTPSTPITNSSSPNTPFGSNPGGLVGSGLGPAGFINNDSGVSAAKADMGLLSFAIFFSAISFIVFGKGNQTSGNIENKRAFDFPF